MGTDLSRRGAGRSVRRAARQEEQRPTSEAAQAGGRGGSDSRSTKAQSGERIPKKLKALVLEEERQSKRRK